MFVSLGNDPSALEAAIASNLAGREEEIWAERKRKLAEAEAEARRRATRAPVTATAAPRP